MVFSTDTEIDDDHFQTLRDDIAHSYQLDYNQDKGCTDVTTGYLWADDDGDDLEEIGLEQVEQ
jgi:hypothetical protein